MKTTLFSFLTATAVTFGLVVERVRAEEGPFADLPAPQSLTEPSFSLAAEAADDPENTSIFREVFAPRYGNLPRFQAFADLLYLQPGAGNLEYGTLVSPLPAPSPHWENQTIKPNFSPGFNIGFRYMVPETGNDFRKSWTHLDTNDGASFVGSPLQFAGPPYLIGPGANAYNVGRGSVSFHYDAANFEAGHLWRAGRPFQIRTFGGVQVGSVKQDLTGRFADYADTVSTTYTSFSQFVGAGPRFGVNTSFNRGNLQFVGDMAAFALIGPSKLRQSFDTVSATFPGGNPQSFSSPNATQVVPGFDSRLGGAYSFALGRGIFKIEAGYQAAVYINAINSYSLTQVATPPVVGGVGVFMATAEHLQNNFTAHGPYFSSSYAF